MVTIFSIAVQVTTFLMLVRVMILSTQVRAIISFMVMRVMTS